MFQSLDRDIDGVLRLNEVKQLFFNIGFKVTDEDVSKLISDITAGTAKDVDEHSLAQFMTESMASGSADGAAEVFRAVSKTHKGLVTAEEIRVTLEANGVTLTEEEAGELVIQHKKRPDTPTGTLTVEEFVAMLS